MDYEFVQKYMEPKRTGNIIRDLNPMSKLNLMLVLGLSPFIVQNYIYGFGMVLFFILVSAAAGCFRSFFSMYWKVLLLFGVFLFLVKAAFAPGEHVLFEIWGICITKESMIAGLDIVSLVLAFSGGFILFVKTTPMEDFTYMLEQKGVSHMVSIAMDARAFSAPVSHTFLSELPPAGRREKGMVYLFDAAFIMLIIGRILLCIL